MKANTLSPETPEGAAEVEPCDHEWEFQDDSFDHEFGTEVIRYWACEKCGATKATDPSDFEADEETFQPEDADE